ncbi:MAG: tyrosine-type recombinase/integrase [Desulfobulbaceae bacterium]|nr:tyrosine-type recombinase/integrase [Desulfobulbaceae bacterium]
MASITKIDGQYRVRYYVHLPSGAAVERSRRCDRAGEAKALRALADVVESRTRRQQYTSDEVAEWQREGLVSLVDIQRLLAMSDGRKTVAQAADDYRETWGRISTGEREAREGRVARVVDLLGASTPIGEVRHMHGERVKASLRAATVRRGEHLKAATVNKHLQDLRRMFRLQVATGALAGDPFSMLKGERVPKDEKIRHVVLTHDQIATVLEVAAASDATPQPALGGHMTLYLLMFLGCGLRRKEALDARIENIDWDKRMLRVVETKTGVARWVGLGGRLFNLLAPRKGEQGPILPQYAPTSVSRAIARHFRRCGIVGMRLHDSRHTYTTRLLDLGVEKRQARHRTGHEDERMLNHYDHTEASGEVFEDRFPFMSDGK